MTITKEIKDALIYTAPTIFLQIIADFPFQPKVRSQSELNKLTSEEEHALNIKDKKQPTLKGNHIHWHYPTSDYSTTNTITNIKSHMYRVSKFEQTLHNTNAKNDLMQRHFEGLLYGLTNQLPTQLKHKLYTLTHSYPF